MQDAATKPVEEVCAFFSVDLDRGLNDNDVAKARSRYGKNALKAEEGTPLWHLILKQFDDLLVKILLGAAILDFIIALTDGEHFISAMLEPGVIFLILIANATVGVVTERNAEQAIEELKAYEAETATVLRNGQLQLVPSADLVPGDVVEVAVGAKIPADVRLCQLYSKVLKVDQSILTGECHSVEKSTEAVTLAKAVYQDKVNTLFSGTLVTAGRGRGVVVGTGGTTAIGKIRDAMVGQEAAITPLKQKLDEFGELLSKVIAAICILVWLMNINRFKDPALGGWVSGAIYYFKIAVALAVAAIPEGLPAVVTTCLALGTRKMARQHAIVRTLQSVETLGCTTVICSDKTGTLTTNQMCVIKVAVVAGSGGALNEYDVEGTTFSPEGSILGAGGVVLRSPSDSPCLVNLAMCSALCNDSAMLYNQEKGAWQRIGESTELALRVFSEKVGVPSGSVHPLANVRHSSANKAFVANAHWQERHRRTVALEFSRDRKLMSVLCQGDGSQLLWAKGAPESILSRCTTALANNGEGVVPLTDTLRAAILGRMNHFGSRQALRCLALACRPVPQSLTSIGAEDEAGMTFLGLVGMHDPPRTECRAALEICRAAGIRVVMVTGDNKATAEAVCRQIGAAPGHWPSLDGETDSLLAGGDSHSDGGAAAGTSFTGQEFDELNATAQNEAVSRMLVFSRVEPLHKLRLVELLQAQGHVVAMTGDGVNDAPALVKADIGVAMGSGTAVARSAADMVLADDNFASIVSAVKEGRAIYMNTKQFIRYMISSNIGEVVAIFLAALLGAPEVLSPVQLLWVNLVTDGLPATALGFNRADKDIMTQAPRSATEPIVNGWLFVRYLVVGMYVGVATVWGYLWWFMQYTQGPQVSWHALTTFQKCDPTAAIALGYKCDVFQNPHPRTIAMTVLVVVEMFNALNNLSENTSLLVLPPWDNVWLLGAISTSMTLHFFILYFPPAAALFAVTPLTWGEWVAVLWLSFPVILVDEVMKFISRRLTRARQSAAGIGSNGGGGGGIAGGGGGSGAWQDAGSRAVGASGGGGGSAWLRNSRSDLALTTLSGIQIMTDGGTKEH